MGETAAVADLLRRSLAHLATEVPRSLERLVAELGAGVIEVRAGTETFTVHADGAGVVVTDGPAAAPGPRVEATRAVILQVIDAEVGLADAVESGRLGVRGSVDDVLRAHDALLAYAHAAVRAPSAPGLLAALRDGGVR